MKKNKKTTWFKLLVLFNVSFASLIPTIFLVKNITENNTNHTLAKDDVILKQANNSSSSEQDQKNNFITQEIKNFKVIGNGLELVKSFKVSGNVNFKVWYSQQVQNIVESGYWESWVDLAIDNVVNFDFIVNDNEIKIVPQNKELANHTINYKTGQGINNKFKVPQGIFASGLKPFKPVNPDVVRINFKRISDVMLSGKFYDSAILKNTIQQYCFHEMPHWINWNSAYGIASGLVIMQYGFDSAKFNLNYDLNSGFFNQLLYHFSKSEVINWINFAFDSLSEEDRQLLAEGPDGSNGRDWNLSDLSSGRMPSLLNWNNNVFTLFEMDKVFDLINTLEKWINEVAGGSTSGIAYGWSTEIEKFIQAIKSYRFSNYNQLQKIYQKYYPLSLKPESSASAINEFIKEIGALPVNDTYKTTALNNLNTYLKKNKITPPALSVGTNLPFIGLINNFNSQFAPYKLLSFYLKGVLNSNDVYADVNASIDGSGKKISKGLILYSSNSNELNNSVLRNAFIDTSVEQGGKVQKVSLSNFGIKNDNNKKFLNIASDNNDYNSFNLKDKLININIKFNPNAMDFDGFGYENWTKNKDAIGISLNKYLSETILLVDETDAEGNITKERFSFLNKDIKENILNLINGKYEYFDNNILRKMEKPVWIKSGRAEFSNYQAELLSDLFAINKSSINGLIERNLFSIDEWNDALSKFNIKTDIKSRIEPLFAPNQANSEFFIVGKIDGFNKSSNYLSLKNKMLNNQKPPIVLINTSTQQENVNNPNGDGYFLIKLKMCFDKTFDFNINDFRFYEVLNSGVAHKTIKWSLETYIKSILASKENASKYWKNNKQIIEHNSFFKNEGWTVNNYDLNINKIWFDILSNEADAGIILDAKTKEIAVDFFKAQTENKLLPFLIKKYGEQSQEVVNYQYYLNNFNNIEILLSAISNESNVLKENKPYIFSKNLWSGVNAYEKYQKIHSTPVDANLEGAFKTEDEKQQAIDNDPFNKALIENEKNEFKIVDKNQILEMYRVLATIKTFLLIQDINNESAYPSEVVDKDEFIMELRTNFFKYYRNWNLDDLNPSGGDGFGLWVQSIKDWLVENNAGLTYKADLEKVFLENYGDWLLKGTNRLVFKVGNEVNDNLLFSSVEEMVNDPLINLILENAGINVDEAFIKEEYVVNDSIVENQYVYRINENIELPFGVSNKYINGVKYYAIVAGTNDLTLNIDVKMLAKMANIHFTKNNKKVYKLINPVSGSNENNVVYNQINNLLYDLERIEKRVEKEKNTKTDYWSSINVGAICLVTILPLTIIGVSVLVWWLMKSKKRKTQF